MNTQARIKQLEKQVPKGQSNYEKSLEVSDTLGGIIQDVDGRHFHGANLNQ